MKRAPLLLLLIACNGPYDWDLEREPEREVVLEPSTPRAPEGEAIEYTLRFPAPHTHYVEVEVIYPTGGAEAIELSMAVWTPGSYLVREYARHLEQVRAATLDGAALAVDKSRKNRWKVTTGGASRVAVRYRVYAREMSVRTNFVDAEMAILNGAPLFLTLVDGERRAHDVKIELPEAWKHSVTGLPVHPSGDAHHYLAPDYDILVDSPIVLGNPTLYEFDVQGVPHVLANFGEGGVWDGKRSAEDVEKLAAVQAEFWGTVPYERYVFFNIIGTGGGGLEHLSSTLMMTRRWMTRKREHYLRWLGLVSHEFFHTWNVKRLRPVELGPFDYEHELHTESLWVAEGITSYYDDLLLERAGLMKKDEYLEALSGQIEAVQSSPGRKVQSLSQASYDAWIKYYRSDENSKNSSISYYQKGAVVAFLIDVEIRRATHGARSLDDAMRLAYERHSGAAGFTPAQFRAAVDEVAGVSLSELFDKAVDGTEELDYGPALEYFGLQFKKNNKDKDDEDDDEDDEPGWLGAETEGDRRITVRRVLRETPAYGAGLNVGDEIIAIDDYRVRSLGDHLERYRPDDEVTLLVARRGHLLELPVVLGKKPDKSWKLEVASKATPAQRRRVRAWLHN